eukprot:CAMPEP_0205903902 /NCGR_PEP_ID=MMETSP1325-20131115/388_1 /ASSEMBLY_ACC=CAM_ASM_000708 /TAXON_ID=236786 /ORGANISM="Florenciella sp., Strain RCC1007" /LENGTH=333 /DNA_ID=CAMNT_0053269607 /DNA_START=43 /DNA_END=1044 /DNA_ORIENTATION=+
MGFPAVFGLVVNLAALSLYDYYAHFVKTSAEAIASGPGVDAVALADPALSWLPDWGFVVIRLVSALVVVATALSALMSKTSVWITTHHLSGSKFSPVRYDLKGPRRFATFTVQTWCLLGVYFILSSAVSAAHLLGVRDGFLASPYLSRCLWVMYEICLSYSILVTVIVTFALIPMAKKRAPKNLAVFMTIRPLLMHNANVLLMFTELLMNRLKVDPMHLPMILSWGLWYVVFAWWWHRRTGVFFYPFMDYSLPNWKILGLKMAVMSAMAAFFYGSYRLDQLVESHSHTVSVHGVVSGTKSHRWNSMFLETKLLRVDVPTLLCMAQKKETTNTR